MERASAVRVSVVTTAEVVAGMEVTVVIPSSPIQEVVPTDQYHNRQLLDLEVGLRRTPIHRPRGLVVVR